MDGNLIDATALPLAMRFTATREYGPHRALDDVGCEHIEAVFVTVRRNKTRSTEIPGIDR
ncbi:MAG: hypothetical protein AMXMBFR20_11920 [Planctomycetia bacterium]